jgi:hypothetical protein
MSAMPDREGEKQRPGVSILVPLLQASTITP